MAAGGRCVVESEGYGLLLFTCNRGDESMRPFASQVSAKSFDGLLAAGTPFDAVFAHNDLSRTGAARSTFIDTDAYGDYGPRGKRFHTCFPASPPTPGGSSTMRRIRRRSLLTAATTVALLALPQLGDAQFAYAAEQRRPDAHPHPHHPADDRAPVAPTVTLPARSSSVVAKDGSGNFTSVQAAVNAVPAGNTSRYTITIRPGTYRELVTIPPNKPYISFVGSTGNARDVVITYDNACGTPKPDGGTYGTSGSASVDHRRQRLHRQAPDLRQQLRRGGARLQRRAGGGGAHPGRPAGLRQRPVPRQPGHAATTTAPTPARSAGRTSATATSRATSTSSSAGAPRSSTAARSGR